MKIGLLLFLCGIGITLGTYDAGSGCVVFEGFPRIRYRNVEDVNSDEMCAAACQRKPKCIAWINNNKDKTCMVAVFRVKGPQKNRFGTNCKLSVQGEVFEGSLEIGQRNVENIESVDKCEEYCESRNRCIMWEFNKSSRNCTFSVFKRISSKKTSFGFPLQTTQTTITITTLTTITTTTTATTTSYSPVNGCDPGWTENPATANGCGAGWTKNPTTGSCYKILIDSGTSSWYNAEPQCESENAELASIRTSQEWTFVKDLVSNSGINGVWLGGNDIPAYIKNTGKWLWADGSTVNYTAWLNGLPRPNNNFNCMRAIAAYAWEWTDYYCASETQYPLCKKPATCYKILMENGTTSWYDAKKNCESQQAELASIRSSQEWTLVKDLVLKSGINGIWLGGSDIADKNTGIWKWTDESRFTYTAWMSGVPRPFNNFNCLRAIATFAWEWTDYYCDSDSQYAICKIPA